MPREEKILPQIELLLAERNRTAAKEYIRDLLDEHYGDGYFHGICDERKSKDATTD